MWTPQRTESGNGVVMQSDDGDDDILNLKNIELSLSLPGTKKRGTKRGFSDDDTVVDLLHLGTSSSANDEFLSSSSSSTSKPPAPKEQVVGWPPVRSNRKNGAMMMSKKSCCCKYVKVAVDGAPYLRKVDLEMYDSYENLLTALESMFCCLSGNYYLNNERKLLMVMVMDPGGNGTKYIPTYEDKDGDWMLLGDVPWKMFVESCKRIRLMIKL